MPSLEPTNGANGASLSAGLTLLHHTLGCCSSGALAGLANLRRWPGLQRAADACGPTKASDAVAAQL